MKRVFLIVLMFFAILEVQGAADVISGKINHDDMNYLNRVVDTKTGQGLGGAKITIPDLNYSTYSDIDGAFRLNATVGGKTVLFIEKEGYKTFSLTIDNSVLNAPLKLGLEQSNPFDLQIANELIHLGDNMFSTNSANSTDFRLNAQGAFMSKKFSMPKYTPEQDVVLVIGTVIGLDTKKAKELGQNKIATVYASPAEIYVNGHRIGSLELNGDNIEINIPRNILKAQNELVIKAGKNLFQHNYVDYDDIELANIRIEAKRRSIFARR